MEPAQQRLSQAIHDHGSYDSDFSDDENYGEPKKRKRTINEDSLLKKPFQKEKYTKVAHRHVAAEELDREEARNRRFHLIAMNAAYAEDISIYETEWMTTVREYERHKKLVNDYILYYGGKKEDFRRSGENDKTDLDVIRENHRFLWNEEDEIDMTWEKRLAKKYYDKLFKEYCIADLSRYKDNKFGFRWRVEKEVVSGKECHAILTKTLKGKRLTLAKREDGQFFCGNKRCDEKEGLKSWEVNFGYIEHGEKRNALVKLRLCQECSFQLNFHHRKKEVKPKKIRDKTEGDCEDSSHKKSKLSSSKMQTSKKKKRKDHSPSEKSEESDNENCEEEEEGTSEAELWKGPLQETDEKSQEEEFDEYFQDLFL